MMDRNAEKISALFSGAEGWDSVKEYVDPPTQRNLISSIDQVCSLFSGVQIELRGMRMTKVKESDLVPVMAKKFAKALSTDTQMNYDFMELCLDVLSSMDMRSASPFEVQMKLRDIVVLSDVMRINSELLADVGRGSGVPFHPADNIDGMRYFWQYHKSRESHPSRAAQKFCMFLLELVTTMQLTGKRENFVTMLNKLAVPHAKNTEGFQRMTLGTMLEKMV